MESVLNVAVMSLQTKYFLEGSRQVVLKQILNSVVKVKHTTEQLVFI